MLLALAGVTGIGKSYYTNKIVEKFGFERLKILTTRKPREGEKNGVDKIFVNSKELQNLRDNGKIGFEFDLLGFTYAYMKDDLFSDKNKVFELHYSTIFDFKKVCPNLYTIYLLPKDIEIAKDNTRMRNLEPTIEKNRLLEIDEHYNRITTDENLRKQFDCILYNNYNETSEKEIIDLVTSLLNQ